MRPMTAAQGVLRRFRSFKTAVQILSRHAEQQAAARLRIRQQGLLRSVAPSHSVNSLA